MKSQLKFLRPLRLFSLTVITLITLALSYQNCGGKFGTLELQEAGSLNLLSLSSCLKESKFDACIFDKHPWNKAGTAAASIRSPEEASSLQDMGIQLPSDVLTGQNFNNGNFKINSAAENQFNGIWKVPYSLQNRSTIHHLMAYYWSERAANLWQLSSGQNLFDNQNVIIETDANVSGWASSTKTLYLKLDEGAKSHAIDASSIVHLISEAALDIASKGKIYAITDASKFKSCGLPGKPVYSLDCCSSFRGCSIAVSAGISDFLVSQVFKRNPAVADGISADPLGQKICNIHRNPILNVDLKAQNAFEACASEERSGQVFVMGAFYASLWLSAQKAALQNGIAESDFQMFLQDLAPALDGNDDFLTVLQKIKVLDATAKYNGKFSSLFENEYRRRGL